MYRVFLSNPYAHDLALGKPVNITESKIQYILCLQACSFPKQLVLITALKTKVNKNCLYGVLELEKSDAFH